MPERRWGRAPWMMGALLLVMVLAAPVVNSTGRPPRTVFLVLPGTAEAPRLALEVEASGGGRYLVRLEVAGFRFTDLCLSHAEAVPVGHAHVHVNGKKVASAFQPVVEIGPLPPGRHVIGAVLRGQDHRAIVSDGGLVQGDTEIVVPAV